MTYWCSDHRQWERDSPHTPDSVANELRDEIDALRAELEDLKRQRQLWMDQASKVERLTSAVNWQRETIKARDAEIERQRAALQEIVDHPAPSHVNNVAREALGQ